MPGDREPTDQLPSLAELYALRARLVERLRLATEALNAAVHRADTSEDRRQLGAQVQQLAMLLEEVDAALDA